MRREEVSTFVKAALECSVYVAPTDPGLTNDELLAVGRALSFREGEIGDVLQESVAPMYFGERRLFPRRDSLWGEFHVQEDPDYRNIVAFDFVCVQLRELARAQGAARAAIERSVLVERAKAAGLPAKDVEVAITILLYSEHLLEKDKVLRFAPGRHEYPSPKEQYQQMVGAFGRDVVPKEMRRKVYPVVRDVIERRTDGRPKASESLDAFADALETLGYAPFRLWWKQTVAELRLLDTTTTPVATAVLSAALVEGALTFVVKHARAQGLSVFSSKDFDRDPRTWKIDDLVSSAATGRESAVLDTSTRQRADDLIKVRQRIHAGRMLSEFPAGVPDLRPEEARDAKTTVEMVIRRVLDWLERYPPTKPST